MGSEWTKALLDNVCLLITDGSHYSPRSVEVGFPMVSVKDFSGFGFDFSNCRQVSKDDYDVLVRNGCRPEIDDILVGKDGARYFEDVIIYKQQERPVLLSSIAMIRANTEKIIPKFLFYYLFNKELRQQVKDNLGSGSAIPRMVLKDVKRIPIVYPDLETQHSIAATLSSLDDKIELNNHIIANLEAQAQAIFDEWFMAVDVDSPVGVLSDIAEVNPTRNLSKGQLATYIEMSNLSTSNSFPDNWIENKPYNGGMRFKNGDTVIARITPCLENGKTGYISCLEDDAVGFGSTEYIVLSAKAGYCNEMLYFLARNEDFRNYAIRNMNGSSGRQRVSGETIGNYEMAVPTVESSRQFEVVVKPIMETIHNCAMQNRKLAKIRDTLLPKLMSREIEVPVDNVDY